jgi:fibronectin-binding autotransporter adhesin
MTLVSLSSMLLFASPRVFAATRTWTGAGSDTNMNTATNWGGTAPVAGDDLVFPANITNRIVVNNYVGGTSFNTITFSGAATQASDYTISGNAIVLVAGISDTMTRTAGSTFQTVGVNVTLNGAQTFNVVDPTIYGGLDLTGTLNTATYALSINSSSYVFLAGVVSGSGAITKTGTGPLHLSADNSAYTGAISASAGQLEVGSATALGANSAGTTISGTGALTVCAGSNNVTIAEPITIGGAGNGIANLFTTVSCGAGGSETAPFNTVTLSGAVSLTSDVAFSGYQLNAKVTGTLTANGHAFTVVPGSTRSLELPSGIIQPTVVTTTYSANSPGTVVYADPNHVSIVTGTYGDVFVGGGTLKGTGSIGVLSMSDGIVAPGMSPGCLSTTGITFSGGTYQAELGGTTACTQYDQLKVIGSVALGVATKLDVSRYQDFKPAVGDKFTIIDNDAADAVTGTFLGLAEGASITVDSYVFTISYVGGDGNDVVLTTKTAPAVPAAPKTGFKLITANPFAVLAATLTMTGTLVLLSRRYAAARVRK